MKFCRIDLPQTVLLADELQKKGISVDEKIITKEEMAQQLKNLIGR